MQRRQFRQAALGPQAAGAMAKAWLPLEAHPLHQHPLLPQPLKPGPQLAGLLIGQALLIQQKQIAEPLAPQAVLRAEPAALPQALLHGGGAIQFAGGQALPAVERPAEAMPLRQGQQVCRDRLEGNAMQLGIPAAGQALHHQAGLAPPPPAHAPLHRRHRQQQADGQEQCEIQWQQQQPLLPGKQFRSWLGGGLGLEAGGLGLGDRQLANGGIDRREGRWHGLPRQIGSGCLLPAHHPGYAYCRRRHPRRQGQGEGAGRQPAQQAIAAALHSLQRFLKRRGLIHSL